MLLTRLRSFVTIGKSGFPSPAKPNQSLKMWDFFRSRPKCPIDPEQQQWIDGRFDWLLDQFGRETPCQVRVIIPTREDFPDPYEGKPEDAQVMMARVAEYMNVDPDQIELFLYSEANP